MPTYITLSSVGSIFKYKQLFCNFRHSLTLSTKRYIQLGTTGKAVPGVKIKITERNDEVLKTPMLEGGFAPEIGGVSLSIFYIFVSFQGLILLLNIID